VLARHRQAGGAGAHYFEAWKAYAEEFEKMKIHPIVWGGDFGAGALSVSGGADRAGAPRKWMGGAADIRMGWRAMRFRSGPRILAAVDAWMRWLRPAVSQGSCR